MEPGPDGSACIGHVVTRAHFYGSHTRDPSFCGGHCNHQLLYRPLQKQRISRKGMGVSSC